MKVHEYNEMMRWLTRPAPDPSIKQQVAKGVGSVITEEFDELSPKE